MKNREAIRKVFEQLYSEWPLARSFDDMSGTYPYCNASTQETFNGFVNGWQICEKMLNGRKKLIK